jgi:hypothetical protein
MAKDPSSNYPAAPTDIDVDAERAQALSVIVARAINSAPTRVTLDRRRRKELVSLLAEGLTLTAAARAIGMSTRTIAHERQHNSEFDHAVTDAIELGCDAILGRVQAIAMHGDPKSMATVRAAEVYLQGNHPNYRKSPGTAGVRLTRQGPDGSTQIIEASSNLIAQ